MKKNENASWGCAPLASLASPKGCTTKLGKNVSIKMWVPLLRSRNNKHKNPKHRQLHNKRRISEKLWNKQQQAREKLQGKTHENAGRRWKEARAAQAKSDGKAWACKGKANNRKQKEKENDRRASGPAREKERQSKEKRRKSGRKTSCGSTPLTPLATHKGVSSLKCVHASDIATYWLRGPNMGHLGPILG